MALPHGGPGAPAARLRSPSSQARARTNEGPKRDIEPRRHSVRSADEEAEVEDGAGHLPLRRRGRNHLERGAKDAGRAIAEARREPVLTRRIPTKEPPAMVPAAVRSVRTGRGRRGDRRRRWIDLKDARAIRSSGSDPGVGGSCATKGRLEGRRTGGTRASRRPGGDIGRPWTTTIDGPPGSGMRRDASFGEQGAPVDLVVVAGIRSSERGGPPRSCRLSAPRSASNGSSALFHRVRIGRS